MGSKLAALSLVVLMLVVACGGAQSAGPASYRDTKLGEVVMTKPFGAHVRTSSTWVGPMPTLNAPDGHFTALIMEGASTLNLYVPKALAGQASAFDTSTTLTVEGHVQNMYGKGIPVVVVHRFAE